MKPSVILLEGASAPKRREGAIIGTAEEAASILSNVRRLVV
jgi:hypothetical protein